MTTPRETSSIRYYAGPTAIAVVCVFFLGAAAYAYRWDNTHLEYSTCTDISRLISACLTWSEAEMVTNQGVLMRIECDQDGLYSLCMDDACFGRHAIYANGDPHIHFVRMCEEAQ